MLLFFSYIIINLLSFRGITSPLLRIINPIVCFSLNVVINLFSHWVVTSLQVLEVQIYLLCISCNFLKHSSLFYFLSFHRFFFLFRCSRSRCCPLSGIINPMFLLVFYIIINPLSFRGIASPLLRVIDPIVCFFLNVVINLFSHWVVTS
jgi:hypothetical protein